MNPREVMRMHAKKRGGGGGFSSEDHDCLGKIQTYSPVMYFQLQPMHIFLK